MKILQGKKKHIFFVFKTIAIIIVFITAPNHSNAQTPPPNYDPLKDIDSQLRVFFSPICVPDTGRFLYEMSTHVLKEEYFSDNSSDTLTVDTWYKLYEEFRKMAYDTTWMLRHDTVYDRGTVFNKDTVMMDIMCYNFYTLHDSALTTDSFFYFDTTNYTIADKSPCELYPYVHNRVFASSPTTYALPYNQVTYRIDEKFIFHDQWNNFLTNNWDVEIDFDDGAGWQHFPPIPVSGASHHYDATYNTSGIIHIKTRVFDPSSGTYIMYSIAQAFVPDRRKAATSSWKLPFNGATLEGWDPCDESGQPLDKVILVVEGYDFDNNAFNNRTAGDVYNDLIVTPQLDDLRNFGYTIAVVDWEDARKDIRTNAGTLVGIIDWLKCQQQYRADTGTHEQFVIITESMGGLVVRYAMCDMEQNWQNMNGCLDYKMHNTRLLITYDSPHEGVNIPLAYQHIYRDAGKYLFLAPTITQTIAGRFTSTLLDGKAVRQMLLYHVDTKNPITDQYFEHPDRTIFKTALSNLGDYPQYCKMIAMSNGSLGGHGQSHIFTGNDRVPNDNFMNWDQDFYVRLLGDDIQLAGSNFELNSTPNGSGNLAILSKDIYRPKISFKVIIKYRWPLPPKVVPLMIPSSTYWFSINNTHHANGLEPYDVIPGSFNDLLNDEIHTGTDLSTNAKGLFFGGTGNNPVFDPNTGTWNFTSFGAGVGRGANGSRGFVNASFSTDGLHFCFVPVFSALSYNLGNNYWHDIESENIIVKTSPSTTPFHVITGIVREDNTQTTPYRYNEEHIFTRNDFLGQWYNGDSATSGNFVRYDTCQTDPFPSPVHFLNREIGDDSLRINNRISSWTCLYDAEKYIGIDEQNPYYEHPNYVTPNAIVGVYSKENNYFSINGTTYFKVRSNVNNIVFSSWPVGYPIVKDTITWVRCCGIDALKPSRNTNTSPFNNTIDNIVSVDTIAFPFKVYPNPASNKNDLIIEFNARSDEKGIFQLYDILGRKLIEQPYEVRGYRGLVNYKLDLSNIQSAGTYFLILKNSHKTYSKSIIIQ